MEAGTEAETRKNQWWTGGVGRNKGWVRIRGVRYDPLKFRRIKGIIIMQRNIPILKKGKSN